MRRWYSSCAWLDKLGGASANRAQSLVETGDGLPQVFALLHNHLRLALGKSHRRGDRPRHIGTAEGADRVGALRIVQLVDVGIIEAWEEVLVTAFLQELHLDGFLRDARDHDGTSVR